MPCQRLSERDNRSCLSVEFHLSCDQICRDETLSLAFLWRWCWPQCVVRHVSFFLEELDELEITLLVFFRNVWFCLFTQLKLFVPRLIRLEVDAASTEDDMKWVCVTHSGFAKL